MSLANPFPGMNPYLEQHWRDVHASLIIYARDQLQANLPGDLRARVEERVFVESPQGRERSMYPDVRVIERGQPGPPSSGGVVAVVEPLVIKLADEPMTETFIEIIDVGTGNRVVTVIEFLSLANKQAGEGQDLYLQKQKELKEGRVSLVEIDLLRAGRRVLRVAEHLLPPSHRTPYRICVQRGWKPTEAEVYPVSLRQPLPAIKVPLREADADVPLDLQALIDECYRKSRYDDIDYRKEPDPPLAAEDASWADALLRGRGLR